MTGICLACVGIQDSGFRTLYLVFRIEQFSFSMHGMYNASLKQIEEAGDFRMRITYVWPARLIQSDCPLNLQIVSAKSRRLSHERNRYE